jgi:anthranilate 1,2-dioxygenase small subunit
VQVVDEEGGAYEVRSNYAVIRIMEHDGSSAVFSSGQYRDSVLFEGGTPRFRRRHVVFDSKAIDTLLVYPI